MTQLATYPLRIRFNADTKGGADVDGNVTPSAWRGNDVTFYVGAFFNDQPLDLSNFASLLLQIKDKQNPTSTALAEVELEAADITGTITAQEWTDETNEHGSFAFTAAQMNQSLGGAASANFWLVLSGLTDAGKAITLGAVELKILEDNAGVAGTPPTPAEDYYTSAEIDALLGVRPPSLALASHNAVRALVTVGAGAVVVNTMRFCYVGGMIEGFIYTTGTDADNDADYLRADDYDGAHVWKRFL